MFTGIRKALFVTITILMIIGALASLICGFAFIKTYKGFALLFGGIGIFSSLFSWGVAYVFLKMTEDISNINTFLYEFCTKRDNTPSNSSTCWNWEKNAAESPARRAAEERGKLIAEERALSEAEERKRKAEEERKIREANELAKAREKERAAEEDSWRKSAIAVHANRFGEVECPKCRSIFEVENNSQFCMCKKCAIMLKITK